MSDGFGDEFDIIRELGEGDNATVFLARESSLRRLVAIKVLKEGPAENETVRKRFGREGRSMARIAHSNVVQVYRVGELPDETPFIVMEYVAGRTIRDGLAAGGSYSPDRAEEILEQVAGALEAAHKEGVIHRDLRPGNVLEEQETGRIVLTDFGLAGVAPSRDPTETKLTIQGQLLGNPRYASPEQLQGETVTEFTDTYSLGILGYELLTRQLPYEASSNVEMLTAHLQKAPIPLRSVHTEVQAATAELLERCLRKKPEQRPTSSEIRERLERIRSGEVMEAAGGGTELDPFDQFLGELSRRHVGKVTLTYVFGGFVVLNVLQTLFPAERFDGFLQVFAGLYVLGIPITAVLAWVYDITSEGIQRTEAVDEASNRGMMRVLQGAGILASLALTGGAYWWFFLRS